MANIYENIVKAIEAVVASPAWPTDRKTYPANFSAPINSTTKFFKLEINFYNNQRVGYSSGSSQIQGAVVVGIYHNKSDSRRDIAASADTLRGLLEDRTFTTLPLQFGKASLSFLGNDPNNSSLQRADLTVPFSHTGE